MVRVYDRENSPVHPDLAAYVAEFEHYPLVANADTAFTMKGDPGCNKVPGPARISITVKEAELLADMARGKDVIEIGTGTGFSAFAMSTTAHTVTTLDIDPFVHEHVFPKLEARGIFCAHALPPLGWGCPSCAHRQREGYGFAFIDGHHTADDVVRDYRRVLPFLAPGSMVAFHDLHNRSMKRGLTDIGIEPEELGTALHIGVISTGGADDIGSGLSQ